MAFQPSDTLLSRTFLGLIIAQFLAAFNDQAIHASAMFFAIHHETMTQATAISLMPILFYSPWAIFCTLAGFLADRYSKRQSLMFWKIAEIAITLVALGGFWLGGAPVGSFLGPWLVLSTVFLMGTHSAFFVPAKYGVMPEILPPHLLSKGNGILESTSFLAVILGTVTGGVLSDERVFKGQEYKIGLLLVTLALVGAAASFLIQKMPAANPGRPFPTNLFKPLLDNLRVMIRSRPLALAVLGIAFFTFMVAFMRSTMYMHGETRNERWSELHTSLVVATVALGVGLGSPLAGSFSGGKVELGLVPLGAVGMIVSTIAAAYTISWDAGLIVALVFIGFFSGFYIVPLYTLLQHRAPKTSKGDLIATSNFINVTGAILASLLFFGLVWAAHRTGITPEVKQVTVAHGELLDLKYDKGHPVAFKVPRSPNSPRVLQMPRNPAAPDDIRIEEADSGEGLIELGSGLHKAAEGTPGSEVIVSRYVLEHEGKKVVHYKIRPADQDLIPAYDNERMPSYLFLGASGMTLAILILLCRQLPDFFVRALLWLRSHGRYRLRVIGMNNLPSEGAAILATNCDRFQECMMVLAATDRYTRFILLESAADDSPRPLLRFLARRTGLVVLKPGEIVPKAWEKALDKGADTLATGNLLAVTVDSQEMPREADQFLQEMRNRLAGVPIVPVYTGLGTPTHAGSLWFFSVRRVRVVIGHPLHSGASAAEIRQTIQGLREWLQQTDQGGPPPITVMIPGASIASPTRPAADRQSHP